MPYIDNGYRKELDKDIDSLVRTLNKWRDGSKMDGCVNYIVSRLLKGVYPESYFDYNRAIGVLECAKLEFYRRVVSSYEDKKIKENGDV